MRNMADHQATPEEQNPNGAVPSGENPAAQPDDKAQDGMKADLVKHRQRASEAESKVAELTAQLEAMKSQANAASQSPPLPSSDIADRLARIERDASLRSIQAEMGLTPEQAEKVHEIASENGLSAAEARQVAAIRDSELFSEGASNGFDPAVHGSSRPMPGSAPPSQDERSDYDRQLEGVADYVSGRDRPDFDKKTEQRLLNNLVGRIAWAQAGRAGQHKLIDLPPKRK